MTTGTVTQVVEGAAGAGLKWALAHAYFVGALVCSGVAIGAYFYAYNRGYDAAMDKLERQGDKAQLILDRLASGDSAAADRAKELQQSIADMTKRGAPKVRVVTVYPPGCNTSQAAVDDANSTR